MENTFVFNENEEEILKREEEEESLKLKEGTIVASRYVILKVLGVGGMSIVYKAYDLTLSRDVALKIFFSKKDLDFLLISKILKINSPNIVTIFDMGEWEDKIYIAIEYVKGKNLKSFDIRNWTVGKKLYLIKQIVYGLKSLHDEGILHLDLKPSNILISEDGDVKIADFSISKNILSHLNVKGGSFKFIAPEQLLEKEVDERTDIYQLGLLMKWLFTEDEKNFPEIDTEELQIPQYLKEIINKASAPNKRDRYNNVEQLLQDIESHEKKIKRKKITKILGIVLTFIAFYFTLGKLDDNPSFYFIISNHALILNKLYYPLWVKNTNIRRTTIFKKKKIIPIKISDLNGDGKNEVILVTTRHEVGVERPIWVIKVFSNKGTLLWEKNFYRRIKTLIGRVYTRPLSFRKFVIKDLNGDSRKEIVTFSNHVFFPFFIEVLNDRGENISTFISAGHLDVENSLIFDYDNDGVLEIIIGGVNNEYNKAVFMILDPFKMNGKTPQEKDYYDIEGYKVAQFEKLIRFERSTLNKRFEIRNKTMRITFPYEKVIIETSELKHKELRKSLLYDKDAYPTLYYFFDKKFRIIDFEISDWYKIGISASNIKIDYDNETKRLLTGVEEWNGEKWVSVKISKNSVAWNMVYGKE